MLTITVCLTLCFLEMKFSVSLIFSIMILKMKFFRFLEKNNGCRQCEFFSNRRLIHLLCIFNGFGLAFNNFIKSQNELFKTKILPIGEDDPCYLIYRP